MIKSERLEGNNVSESIKKVKVKIVFLIHDGFSIITKRFSVRFVSYGNYQEINLMQVVRLTLPRIFLSLGN